MAPHKATPAKTVTLALLPGFDLRKIAESGQCFRMTPLSAESYRVIAGARCLTVTHRGGELFAFDCDAETYARLWAPYFDLDTDYARFVAAIPPEDAFLRAAVDYGWGIRILRQDPWEMLITFILSQRKNIPAIRRGVENLCERFGAPIGQKTPSLFAFPVPQVLAEQSAESLAPCGLGYRAPYVLAAARMVANGTLRLEALRSATDEELLSALLAVPGVGHKVASCVMLFGFYRIAAFPRDVWINRVVQNEYGGDFPLHLYEGCAGVLQQYMFHYIRRAAPMPYANDAPA
ncbi:MAG: DNA-3-methyladenine glycosylase 2 family protein [Oscillospiraceae bacterium]|jgi:N-glycosylase/DNA lyase|nr:DNA-3-methyladenine glycosylase 2 family protein [Oscillospiraceae bacterium]